MIKRTFLIVLISLWGAGAALANHALEIPQTYGARLNGTAAAGMAHADGGVAMSVNPAGLASIQKFMFEGTVTGMILTLRAPVNGPSQEKQLTSYSTLGLFGSGVRLHERIVIGFLLYTPSGGGQRYKNVHFGLFPLGPKNDFYGHMVFIEYGPAIAVNLPGNIRIGFVYRFNYIENWARLNAPDNALNPQYVFRLDSHMKGYGFSGYRAGLQWDALEWLHIGAAYRSFVKMETSGKQKQRIVGSATGLGTGLSLGKKTIKENVRYADSASGGITFEPVAKTLYLNLDYSYDLYGTRYKSVIVKVAGVSQTMPYRAKDTHNIRFGIEWYVTPNLPLRAGMGWQNGYGNPRYHNHTSTGAPGRSFIWSIGTGYRFAEKWHLDIALAYMHNIGNVTDTESFDSFVKYGKPVAVAGGYSASGYYASMGLRYFL